MLGILYGSKDQDNRDKSGWKDQNVMFYTYLWTEIFGILYGSKDQDVRDKSDSKDQIVMVLYRYMEQNVGGI